jgi:hypothetical protein
MVMAYLCGLMAVFMKGGGVGASSTVLENTQTGGKRHRNSVSGRQAKGSNGLIKKRLCRYRKGALIWWGCSRSRIVVVCYKLMPHSMLQRISKER